MRNFSYKSPYKTKQSEKYLYVKISRGSLDFKVDKPLKKLKYRGIMIEVPQAHFNMGA